MFNKCRTHLKVLKPDATEETLLKKSWEAVRHSVFHGTVMWAYVVAVRKPPSDEILDALVGQWKAVMEPERKKGNMVAPTTLHYPLLKQYKLEDGGKKGKGGAKVSAGQSNASGAAVNAATVAGPSTTKNDGNFQKAGKGK